MSNQNNQKLSLALFSNHVYRYRYTDILFANSKFIGMARSMNIAVKVTAAKSPFSNRLVQKTQPHRCWHDEKSIRGITTSRHGFNIGLVPRC